MDGAVRGVHIQPIAVVCVRLVGLGPLSGVEAPVIVEADDFSSLQRAGRAKAGASPTTIAVTSTSARIRFFRFRTVLLPSCFSNEVRRFSFLSSFAFPGKKLHLMESYHIFPYF